ncbi:hypothetical protein C8R45DRAFT_1026724 [Mycena sanguinolenta]|nr:hypothetical protein C8R45DRAFT_1026724 [Mycena sanguinolenta]
MPTVFRGPRRSKQPKIVKIYGGMGGSGGRGGVIGGDGGIGEGPRVKIGVARSVTNINKNYSTAPAVVPSGFRTIPLGDIDLQREIQWDSDSGVVSLRTLHSAKIEGSVVTRTVAVYHGNAAEQARRILCSQPSLSLTLLGMGMGYQEIHGGSPSENCAVVLYSELW